jgi:hypothetical protein
MTKKLTAVQWLVEQILVDWEDYFNEEGDFDSSKPPKINFYNAFKDSVDLSEYVNKAIEMEKEQIIKAYANGVVNEISIYSTITGEEYYNETYAKNS